MYMYHQSHCEHGTPNHSNNPRMESLGQVEKHDTPFTGYCHQFLAPETQNFMYIMHRDYITTRDRNPATDLYSELM